MIRNDCIIWLSSALVNPSTAGVEAKLLCQAPPHEKPDVIGPIARYEATGFGFGRYALWITERE